MHKFPNIPDKEFIHYGYRAEPLFIANIIAGGFSNRKNLKKWFQLTKPVTTVFVNYELFNIKSSLNAFTEELNKKMKHTGKSYIQNIVKECFKTGKNLINLCQSIDNDSATGNLSVKKLTTLLKSYHEAAYDYCIFYTIAWFEKSERELAESIAKKYTKNEKDSLKLFALITTPSKTTAAENEQDDFLRLVTHSLKNPADLEKRADLHAKKHGWLGIRYLIGNAWTKEDILQRLGDVDKKQASIMLKNRLGHRKDVDSQLQSWLKKMSVADRQQVAQIRDVIYLRTQRADFYHESSFYIQSLIKKIAQTLRVNYTDLLNFSPPEVLATLRGKFDMKSHIPARRINMITYFNGYSVCLEGNSATQYIQKRPTLQRIIQPTTTLQGNIAFAGKVVGKAKIVLSTDDLTKVTKGDVLIATMTTPNFIAAMERAAAFVTNEGGILCHAAIVSREMRKPCVIGTKIATDIFKDGDLVEVDANNGIVRVLKQ